ncbi:hypothetical protein RB195_018703 [Necator americanus]|uniref:Uncharacterized protein n=1 Tax=Necator americanus TaxID=51031 RepID=A0ABR1CEK5_NECAM
MLGSARPEQTNNLRDGLPVSAEPGLTHDILVSRTSVRPKASNQVTGRCKGGGLESPPANKFDMEVLPKTHGTTGLQPTHGFKNDACHSDRKESPDSGAKLGTKIKYDVIGLIETRRRHPLNAVYETGEEVFLGTCDSRGVGGVGVLVNMRTAKNIDSFEQLTTRIRRLGVRRCGPTPL